MLARGLERRDTSSKRNRINGIFRGRGRRRIPGAIAPDRLNGKDLPTAPSRRLRFEDEDTGQDSPSGHDGLKSKSGKFQEDRRKSRPSDRMRQEDEADGPQDTGKAQEPEGSAEKAGSKKDKYQKAQAKAEHAGEKLGKAREKLDKTEAKRAAKKPPGLAKKAVRGARTEAWFYVHNKIHEVEHENVGVEGAHKSGAGRRGRNPETDPVCQTPLAGNTRPGRWQSGNGRT